MRLTSVKDSEQLRRLIQRRLKATWKTQREMAEHLGISQKHLSQQLQGKAGITIPQLCAMLEWCDLTLAVVDKREEVYTPSK